MLTLLPDEAERGHPPIRLYTDGLLVLLPFPDMSMPFNVIAFTSTVIAFLFGSLFNLFYSTDQQIRDRAQQTPIARLRNAAIAALQRCRRRRKQAAEQPSDSSASAQHPEEDNADQDSTPLLSPTVRRRNERLTSG